jgi:hypothetical protein
VLSATKVTAPEWNEATLMNTDSTLKDFQSAVAVEATEEQRSQFLSWSQNTEAVKLRLQELRLVVAADDFSSQLGALRRWCRWCRDRHAEQRQFEEWPTAELLPSTLRVRA